jgi:hypothetical protein
MNLSLSKLLALLAARPQHFRTIPSGDDTTPLQWS